MTTETDPYACLGLMPGSSAAEIKQSYRRLAKLFHPDRHGYAPEYAEKLIALNAAYSLLTDPVRKFAFDARFSAAFNPAHAAMPRPVPVCHAYRRRRVSLGKAVAATLCVLLSTGFVVLFTAINGPSALAGLFPRVSAAKSTLAPPQFSAPSTQGPLDLQSGPPAHDFTDAGE